MEMFCFGIDIGGTTVKMGLFRQCGELLRKWEIPTRTQNHGQAILTDIRDSVQAVMKEEGLAAEQVAGIGMGVPGPVTQDGTVLGCVNLGWGQFQVEQALQELTGLPVCAGNDANVAALGEQWKGAGSDYKNLVMVTLGTGVGGGIIIDGRIVAGPKGAAGEIGHMPMFTDEARACSCGNTGCLEQSASATGLVSHARRMLEQQDTPSKLRDIPQFTAKDVCDCAGQGDAVALAALDLATRTLGTAMAYIGCVLNPEAFLIGGGMSRAGELIFSRVKKVYDELVFPGCKGTPILPAKLGNDAGIYGAARMVLQRGEH